MATKKKNKYLESISKSASKIESNKEKYAQKEQYDEDTLFGSARSTISENRLRESNNIGESPYKNLSIIRANRQKEEEEAQGSIFDIARNNIASGAASYNRAEKSYMDSLPNDAYRFAYQQSKNTDGVYVSPYFSKGIEGKEKLTYNNDEWNRLSEGERKGYLEWAQQELDKESKKKKPNLERDNKYLNYAMSILNETNQTVRTIGDTHNISGNLFRAFVPDRLEDALGMNKESADTFNKDQELQIMLNMMPEEVRQYLTTGMVPLLRENQELQTPAAVKGYLSNYYSDDMVDKLSKYARKVENIQRQQERNADIERKMDNPFYATVVAPAGQVGMDLLVKPVAGAVDLVRASSEANKGIYGEFDPLQTGVQRMAQDARYINESINEGLGKGGQFIYNTSMSGLESAARMYLANGLARSFPFLNQEVAAKTFLTGMMSSAVFNDSLNENIQKGMDIGDAMSSAMAHSLFESLFEELSFDKLGYFKEAPVMYSKKDFAKSLIKAGFVEGSEEAFTDIANELYDHYVGNYDFSEYKAFKDKYLASNPDATDRDIWWEFTKQFSLQVAQSFAGGALSSFALSSTNNMSALRRGEMYIQNGKNVSDGDFARMDSFVKEMAAVNPEIADEYKKATQSGEDAKRGFVKMVTEEYSEKFNKAIEQADTKDKLNVVMNNVNAALHGAISEDTFNTYNAKLVELGETPADYNTFVQNRAKTSAETTFSDLAYGRGDNAIQRNIVEASKSIAETQENANMDKSVREEAIKKLTEKVETNVKKAEETVARYAEMGVPMDSPEVRQFESVLGLQNMAQMYSAGKLAAQNLNLPATTQKSGKLYQVKQNSAEAKRIFGENATHIIEAPFEEVKNSTAYSLGKVISRMTGVNIAFYKSDRQAIQNGAYDAKTNTLYLDVNAGTSGSNYAIGEVFSHELTHWIRANNEEGYQKLMDFIKTDMGAEAFESLVKDHIEKGGLDENVASEEVVAEACQRMLENSEVFKRYAAQDLEGAKTLLQRLVDFIRKLREAFKESLNNDATRLIKDLEGLQKEWDAALSEAIGEKNAEMSQEAAEGILENNPKVAEEIVGTELVTDDSVKLSQRLNGELMEKAEKEFNKTIEVNGVKTTLGKSLGISYRDFYNAVSLCNNVAQRMKTDLAPYLPEDNPGKVEVGNASYGRSMENALVCIRSIVNNDFTDMVSEELGRPLTVEEQLVASQILQIVNSRPECNYCYVATDRRAYRASFGTYFNQYSNVYDKVAQNREAFSKDLPGAEKRMEAVKVDNGDKNNGTGVVAQAYAEFLNGRKNTPDMRKRFLAWVKSAVNGEKPISLKDLSSAKMRDAAREDSAKKWFIYDSENYAQKATWAKKTSRTLKINGEKYVADYVSYNGSILKWSDDLVKKLNSEFGMRMYSFSDYVPAFLLENMQMIIDASLRGLKVLAYTKDCGFAEAFADTGAGINISLFGTLSAQAQKDENLNRLREQYKKTNSDADRKAYLSALDKYVVKDGIGGKDGMMGANWERASSLRKSYGNVGTVFVATNDDLVEWALANPDIDVVIPYHLVRTGEEVASFFNYKNYKAAQEDKKQKEWATGNLKAVPPTVHKNSLELYKKALADNKLTARFSDYIDNPNYMKLVNETRMSYEQLQPVQPVFDQETIMRELGRIKDEGQYGLMPGFKTKAEQDAFIENQNLVGQAVDAIGEWNESGKKPIDDTKYSSRGTERDSEYMSAVNSGDMETAQKYVDEAAKEAGYTEEYYHGSHAKFNSFDLDKSQFGNSGYGIYLGGRMVAAEFGGDDIIRLYVNPDRIARSDTHSVTARQFQSALKRLGLSAKDTYKWYVDSASEYVSKRDDWRLAYDLQDWAKRKKKLSPSEILSILQEELNLDGMQNRRELVLWDNKLLKSADPVTYDDNGNVIPLSERFNKESEDIRYSSRDSSGRELTEAQQEYFKDSKVRDEDGNLMVVYHGTTEKFFTFKDMPSRNGRVYGDGFYFTPDKKSAQAWTSNKENGGKVKTVYLNITNPYYVGENYPAPQSLRDYLRNQEIESYKKRMAQDGANSWWGSKLTAEEFAKKMVPDDINSEAAFFAIEDDYKKGGHRTEVLKELGYDGVAVLLNQKWHSDKYQEFVAFYPEQIKSINAKTPTENPDIRYSTRDSEGRELSEGQQDYFKDSKIRDDEGNLKVMFHGTEADFNIFDFSQGGKNGTAEGFGIYLTDNKDVSKAYGGRIIESYVNITKPAMYNKKSITSSQLVKLIEATAKNQAQRMIDEEGYGTMNDALKDTWISNYTYTYDKPLASSYREVANSIIRMSDNDRDIIQEVMAGMAIRDYDAATDFYKVLQDVLGFDGFVTEWKNNDTGERSEIVLAFNSNQIKNVDNLNPTSSDDIRFSLRDLANSESEIIVNALTNDEALVESLGAKQSIEAYAREYNKLKDMEQQTVEISKQLQKKGTTPSEREVLLKKMVRLDRAILNKTTELTEMRNQRVIRDLLVNEWDKRDTMVAAGRAEERLQTRKALEEKYGKELSELKAKNKAQQKAIRDRQKSKQLKENIIKKTRDIMKRIATPTEKKHVPTVLVKPISELIEAIDYWTPKEGRPVTKTSEQLWTRFQNFKNAVEDLQTETDKAAEAIKDRFDPDFLDYVNQISKYITEQGIDNVNDMNVENLEALDSILTELNHIIKTANDMFSRSRFKTADELRQATKEDLNKRKGLKEGKSDARGNFVRRTNAGMADAYAWAEYAGEGAKEIVNMLSKAYNRKINLIRQATEYTEDVLKPVKNDLKKWEKDEKTFKLESGKELKLNVRTMLDIYLLSKREQGYQHLISDSVSERLEKEAARERGEDVTFYNGGGIRVKDRKGKFRTLMKFTQSDLNQVIDYLKTVPNAIEVAEKLQKFISTEATAWGNKASNDLYGIVKYTEENYWPISTSDITNADNGTGQSVSTNVDMNKIKNYGFTKALQQNAKNGVDVDDFLNVFSKHIDEMSSYGELLPALTDAMRWWNSRTDSEDNRDERIKDLMASKIGTDMANVFNSIIIGLNGGTKTQDSLASWIRSLRGKVKAAAIAFNPRVVVQQPFSYTRAAAVIEKKYLTKALTMVPAVKEAQEHSAIAWLKHQGFHSSGIGPSMKKLVTGDGTAMENLVEKTMAPAGWADDITWGTLWNAAKLKVEDTQKNLEKGSQEYFDAIDDVFNEIINRTQVVETPLTQSPWMKSNMGTLYMSFMNEPVKTYSMVMTAIDKVVRDPHNAEARRQLYNAAGTFMVSGFALALAQSLVDAARDDDKELSYWEKYVEKYKDNALDNVNPLTYLPLIKDAWSVAQGYSSKDLTSQGTNEVINATKELIKVAKGESKHTLWGQAEIMARAYSYMSGVPVSNAMRIFKSVGGNMLGYDFFRSTDYTKSELGRNVVLELREGNTEQAEKYFNQLQKKVGEDEDPYAYISDYLSKRDDDADIGARNFLEDANSLEEYAEKIVNKYNSEYVTLDVATDSIRKAARADLKEEAAANNTKYKNTISSGNTAGTLWNGSDINRALENGDIVEAQKLIDKINAGYKKQESNTTAKTSVSNYWKPKYLASSGAERDKIARMLYSLKNNGKQMFSAKDLQKWVSDANKKK